MIINTLEKEWELNATSCAKKKANFIYRVKSIAFQIASPVQGLMVQIGASRLVQNLLVIPQILLIGAYMKYDLEHEAHPAYDKRQVHELGRIGGRQVIVGILAITEQQTKRRLAAAQATEP
jgi:hypothetical protein